MIDHCCTEKIYLKTFGFYLNHSSRCAFINQCYCLNILWNSLWVHHLSNYSRIPKNLFRPVPIFDDEKNNWTIGCFPLPISFKDFFNEAYSLIWGPTSCAFGHILSATKLKKYSHSIAKNFFNNSSNIDPDKRDKILNLFISDLPLNHPWFSVNFFTIWWKMLITFAISGVFFFNFCKHRS